jgi:hypothetical protein
MAIQSAEGVGSSHDSSVNDWVVIWIGRHDAGSWTREDELRHILCSEVAQILSYFFARQFRHQPNALISEHALQFLKQEWGQKENVLWRVDNKLKESARRPSSFCVRPNKNVRIENDPHPRRCRK